jgi:chorismate lyase
MRLWRARPPADAALRDWLAAPGSLTRRLCERFDGFTLRRLRQGAARPNRDEASSLGIDPRRRALVREVLLMGEGKPLVFGHSVVALRHLRGPWRSLRGLGGRPLAEALYLDPRIRRGPLLFRRLDARHPLYRRVGEELGELPPTLWARRSLFRRRGAALLVCEVFLPGVWAGGRRELRRAA